MRVAQEGHALSLRRQSAGLFHRKKCLAAARSPADLDAVGQLDGAEDDGLVFGQRVGRVLICQGAGDNAVLR